MRRRSAARPFRSRARPPRRPSRGDRPSDRHVDEAARPQNPADLVRRPHPLHLDLANGFRPHRSGLLRPRTACLRRPPRRRRLGRPRRPRLRRRPVQLLEVAVERQRPRAVARPVVPRAGRHPQKRGRRRRRRLRPGGRGAASSAGPEAGQRAGMVRRDPHAAPEASGVPGVPPGRAALMVRKDRRSRPASSPGPAPLARRPRSHPHPVLPPGNAGRCGAGPGVA